jgi:hypothetical protein
MMSYMNGKGLREKAHGRRRGLFWSENMESPKISPAFEPSIKIFSLISKKKVIRNNEKNFLTALK